MKILQSILAVGLIILYPLQSLAEKQVVNVYNWANAISPAVIKQFEKETGIKVNYSTFSSNEALYAKLISSPNAGYDVVIPTTYFIERMRKQKMLQPIDKSKLPNVKNINPFFLNKSYDPNNQYSIPYLYGITGIAYNDKFYPQGQRFTWQEFWNPNYKNKLVLVDDPREVFSIALLSLGYSINDSDPKHIQLAFEKLQKLLPNIRLFNIDSQKTLFIDEEVDLGSGWSGHIYLANQENPHVKITYPKEGFIISLDSMVIPKNAPHVDNAHKFIDFMLRAESAKDISEFTGFSTPNQAGVKLLPAEIKNNPIMYPPEEIFKHGQFQADVTPEAIALYEKYFQELKLR